MLLYDIVQNIQNPLNSGVGTAIATADKTFMFLQVKNIGQDLQHKYSWELSLGDTGQWVVPGTQITGSVATVTPKIDNLSEQIASVRIPGMFVGTPSESYEILAKVKVITRGFGNSFINGSGTPDLVGLANLVPASQTIYTAPVSGSALTLQKCDALYNLVSVYAEPTFFVAHQTVIDILRNLYRQSPGTTSSAIQLKTFDGKNTEFVTIQGRPVVPSNWISVTETRDGENNLSSMYAVFSEENDGLHLFYSENSGSQLINVLPPKPVNGAHAVDRDVVMDIGMSLKSPFAVARLGGIRTA